MHNKFDFLRTDWKIYAPKYKLNCNFCTTDSLVTKAPEKEIKQQKRITITEIK